jgi:dTDP-4-amino-4,6-dideoxygalactose transaminase
MTRAHRTIQISQPSTGEEEWQALREPLASGWLTQGPKVAEFETAFAHGHGVRHALATTSCTTALHLALAALRIGHGDEVVVPAFTWIATANAVLYCGATPVFADVDESTYNIDPDALAAALGPRTRAVMPVHLFGLAADLDAIRARLPDDVLVVEDAACAAGARYRDQPVGGLGDAAAFSFHPRKSITTGEGGMLTTDRDDVAELAGRLRTHGAGTSAEDRHLSGAPYLLPAFEELGFNYRMTDLQAAIGVVQLAKLDRFIDDRDRLARIYLRELADLAWLRLPVVPAGCRHAWQAFVTVVGDDAPLPRNAIMEQLHERGIATRPGTHCVPELGVYRERLAPGAGHFPTAAMLERRSMALPLHNRMSEDDVLYVVEALHDV